MHLEKILDRAIAFYFCFNSLSYYYPNEVYSFGLPEDLVIIEKTVEYADKNKLNWL